MDKLRENALSAVGWGEVLLLAGVAFCFQAAAVLVFFDGMRAAAISWTNGHSLSAFTILVDRLLLTLMLIEFLETIRISISRQKAQCKPFLVIGLIAAIRRMLALTMSWDADSSRIASSGFVEMGVLLLMVIGLAYTMRILDAIHSDS